MVAYHCVEGFAAVDCPLKTLGAIVRAEIGEGRKVEAPLARTLALAVAIRRCLWSQRCAK